jgi:hypothetical protein
MSHTIRLQHVCNTMPEVRHSVRRGKPLTLPWLSLSPSLWRPWLPFPAFPLSLSASQLLCLLCHFLRPLSSPPLAARNLARPSATWSISLAPRLDVALINRLGCCSSRTKLALLNHGPPAIISATTLPTCQSPFQPGRNGSTHPPTSPRAHHTHHYSAHCCASLASDLPFLVSTATECSVFWTGMRRTKGALK